jgi:hypothetical protein
MNPHPAIPDWIVGEFTPVYSREIFRNRRREDKTIEHIQDEVSCQDRKKRLALPFEKSVRYKELRCCIWEYLTAYQRPRSKYCLLTARFSPRPSLSDIVSHFRLSIALRVHIATIAACNTPSLGLSRQTAAKSVLHKQPMSKRLLVVELEHLQPPHTTHCVLHLRGDAGKYHHFSDNNGWYHCSDHEIRGMKCATEHEPNLHHRHGLDNWVYSCHDGQVDLLGSKLPTCWTRGAAGTSPSLARTALFRPEMGFRPDRHQL